jgi:hypothetical protein
MVSKEGNGTPVARPKYKAAGWNSLRQVLVHIPEFPSLYSRSIIPYLWELNGEVG